MTAAARVLAAWTNAGPVPEYHRRHQERLRAEWPALAAALDQLAQEPEPDPALLSAARALELHPPMVREQYVATLRLYAAEPWRIGGKPCHQPPAPPRRRQIVEIPSREELIADLTRAKTGGQR